MSELTERGKAFRTAITDFIAARREAKLNGREGDAKTKSRYDYATWLADAASRAHNLQVVTHPIKFTHSAIKGASSVRIEARDSEGHREIGTHSVRTLINDFAITDAKHLDVYSLLKEVVDGRPLIDWFRAGDVDLELALNDDPRQARALMEAFGEVFRADTAVTSSPLAKQIYWLEGDDPSQDNQYHLLQPMFSSSLEHVVNEDVQARRDAAFAARGTRKQKPTFADHSTHPGLVARTIGGSNAQNVSPQNKVRDGKNYLFASSPPPTWRPNARTNVLNRDSAFDGFLWFGNVRGLVNALAKFLRSDPDPTIETRDRRKRLEQALANELAELGIAIRAAYDAGWSRGDDCRLRQCERLWLDPGRAELPDRADPAHPEWAAADAAFKRDYAHGDWADEVATRFGDWLNAQLRKARLVTVSAPERNHFARQAILDVTWPIPRQRHAKETRA